MLPASAEELTVGTRLCAYWSQQYRCLYPGSVAEPGTPDPDYDAKFIAVEFDDGDSGRIPLHHIRLLPPDYPIMGKTIMRHIPYLIKNVGFIEKVSRICLISQIRILLFFYRIRSQPFAKPKQATKANIDKQRPNRRTTKKLTNTTSCAARTRNSKT